MTACLALPDGDADRVDRGTQVAASGGVRAKAPMAPPAQAAVRAIRHFGPVPTKPTDFLGWQPAPGLLPNDLSTVRDAVLFKWLPWVWYHANGTVPRCCLSRVRA